MNPFDPVRLPMAGFEARGRCWPAVEANSMEHVERLFAAAQRDPDTHELVEYRIRSIEYVSE